MKKISTKKDIWQFRPELWLKEAIARFMQQHNIDSRTEAIHKYIEFLHQENLDLHTKLYAQIEAKILGVQP